MPRSTNLPDITKHKPNNPDFKLPGPDSPHPPPRVISLGLFNWKLQPLVEGQLRYVIVTCTKCSKVYKETWSIRTTNLMKHWEVNHSGELRRLKQKAKASGLPREKTIESLPGIQKIDTRTPVIDSFCSRVRSVSGKPTSDRQLEAAYAEFDPKMYREVLLNYISANNLPFAHIESPSLAILLDCVRRCEGPLPSVSRHSLRSALDIVYENSVKSLKMKLANHKGRFALTLDEWKSGNNYDFLGITLHLHNENFVMEKYAIGFEVLNKELSYTGDVLYQHLDRVLSEYDIKDRIISITRDNTSVINSLMTSFQKSLINDGPVDESTCAAEDDPVLEFSGDILCAGHVLNLATNEFLACTFFRASKSGVFSQSMNATTEEHPSDKDIFNAMEGAPKMVDALIKATRRNTHLKNKFKSLVEKRQEEEGNKRGPRTLLRCNDTRWLSIYRMLERFLHFRPEITSLLEIIRRKTPMQIKSFKLPSLFIEDSTWEYLSCLRDILELFLEPTMQLQYDSKETANMTIPLVCDTLNVLEDWKSKDVVKNNPLIELGISKASQKLLEYYPINDANIQPIRDLYIATMLDPHLKTSAFEMLHFPAAVVKSAERYFQDVFNSYKEIFEKEKGSTKRKRTQVVPSSRGEKQSRSFSFYRAIQVSKNVNDENIGCEMDEYFAEIPVKLDESIRSFYERNRDRFPILYRMARDYLSIMAMSAPSESLFSRVRCIVTDGRSRLLPDTIKKLAILKARDILADDVTGLVDSFADLKISIDNESVELREPGTSASMEVVDSCDSPPQTIVLSDSDSDSDSGSESISTNDSLLQNSADENELQSTSSSFIQEDSDFSESEFAPSLNKEDNLTLE